MICRCKKCNRLFVSDAPKKYCSPKCEGKQVDETCIFVTPKGCEILTETDCKGCAFRMTPEMQRKSDLKAMARCSKTAYEFERVKERRW